MEKKQYWIYILCSKPNGTLYKGITNNLLRRIYDHKAGLIDGFTKKYNVNKLVYAQEFYNIEDAIACEKRLKKWQRQWKINLIEKYNLEWKDLYTM
jgi:putative endonuclease